MDKMQPYELTLICDSLHLRVKEAWEQARMISYIIAQVNSKKRLKPTDIIEFGWEREAKPIQEKKMTYTYTEDEVEKLKQECMENEKRLKEMGII